MFIPVTPLFFYFFLFWSLGCGRACSLESSGGVPLRWWHWGRSLLRRKARGLKDRFIVLLGQLKASLTTWRGKCSGPPGEAPSRDEDGLKAR
ncbi:hypothetical protein Peur_050636 [Populus x canadensis]